MSGCCQHLSDDEPRLEDLVRFIVTFRDVRVLDVEPELRQGLIRFADLSVGVTRIVGAVENVWVGRWQYPAVVASDSVKERRGARVLSGVETGCAEKVTHLEFQH